MYTLPPFAGAFLGLDLGTKGLRAWFGPNPAVKTGGRADVTAVLLPLEDEPAAMQKRRIRRRRRARLRRQTD